VDNALVICNRAIAICVFFRDGRISNPSYSEVFGNVGMMAQMERRLRQTPGDC
jgi:hypothetical protein